MDYRSRRSILGLSGAALGSLAGCLEESESEPDDANYGSPSSSTDGSTTDQEPDADDDGVPDARDDYPNDRRLSDKQTQSRTRKLEEDEWLYYELDFPNGGYLKYDFVVRDGPAIDVIFMDSSEYNHFDSGDRYSYKPSVSSLDSIGRTVEQDIPSGSYYLIFDNSGRGEASPPTNFSNDIITVEFEIEIGT